MRQFSEERPVLERILQNVSNIEFLLQTVTEESFLSDLKDFNAICLEFIQIGEKVNQLPRELYDAYPEIPWHELYGLRNRIVHGYEKVKKSIIWATITRDLPVIKKGLMDILAE